MAFGIAGAEAEGEEIENGRKRKAGRGPA